MSAIQVHPTRLRTRSVDQASVMIAVSLLALLICSIFIRGFLSLDNLQTALVGEVPLAILGLAMAITIIGGAIDFSLLVISVCSAEMFIVTAKSGFPLWVSLLCGAIFALCVGFTNGLLVAYVELPALVVTIATALLVFGASRLTFFSEASNVVPVESAPLTHALTGRAMGIPVPLITLGLVSCLLYILLRLTIPGRFIFAKGDNPATARLSGIPVRILTVFTFMGSAVLAFVAGMLMISQGGALSAPQATSAMLYDVITVAVIGGVSLAGGRGRISGVLAGALLVAILLNALTLLNFNENQKAIVQGLVLLGALAIDAVLHPRTVEDFKAGDL